MNKRNDPLFNASILNSTEMKSETNLFPLSDGVLERYQWVMDLIDYFYFAQLLFLIMTYL
jgi:hypothetical protein